MRRFIYSVLGALSALAIMAGAAGNISQLGDEVAGFASQITGEAAVEAEVEDLEEATVVRVVDGDTIVVETGGGESKVRLIGVNTPESVHPDESKNTGEGEQASEHTKSILQAGTVVWLEKDTSDTDQYGRLLRYVWLEKPGNSDDASEFAEKCLNARLVADGWAEAKTYAPDDKWSELLSELEDEAAGNLTS